MFYRTISFLAYFLFISYDNMVIETFLRLGKVVFSFLVGAWHPKKACWLGKSEFVYNSYQSYRGTLNLTPMEDIEQDKLKNIFRYISH